ncbi:MAG: S41 family peptidase [Gloeobacterales cyanobacterium]
MNKRILLSFGATASLALTLWTTGVITHPTVVLAAFEDNPKTIVDEAWQIVNAEYVDGTFNSNNWEKVREEYLGKEYKSKEEAYTAVRQMLSKLKDPYTRFMDPKAYASMQVDTSGELTGVGIQIDIDAKTKELLVIAPIEDTPAAKAGIQPKDVIQAIDGVATKGMSREEAVSKIRGKAGSSVKFTIRRGSEVFDVDLMRSRIELKAVKSDARPLLSAMGKQQTGQLGYIRLSQFTGTAAKEMRQAVQDLNKKNVDGFVLDLRSNPGGLLYASAEIAELFMEEGTIVTTQNREGEVERLSANHHSLTDKPLVILVNEGSASASEILSGALKDNKRAVLVGAKTFGKGLVQSVHSLSDGSGMAVTIAHYKTPSGADIHKKGIQPDFKVALPKKFTAIEVATAADPQYVEAVQALTKVILQAKAVTPAAEPPAATFSKQVMPVSQGAQSEGKGKGANTP